MPLVPAIDTRFTFDHAVDVVLTALAPLGKPYVDALADGLRSQRWCDRYENKGKRSGAFSSSSYGAPPYILMNYKEDVFADVYTLAHEAGHSMHSWFSQNAQLFQDYEYPIFLAEVASTFNEELLTYHLLETTDDLKMRAHWGKFQKAYEDAINFCSTHYAPWHVIPANRKWYRDYVIAKIVVKALEGMKLRWPRPHEDLSKFLKLI